jgi:hypothetical protein
MYLLGLLILICCANADNLQNNGVQETKIFSCDEKTSTWHYDIAAIRYLAQTADSIIIRSNLNAYEYVQTSSADSYALDSLRIGRTLSYTSDNPPGNVVTGDWTGTMVSSMWNSGVPSNALSFSQIPYWACNNFQGLHLGEFPNHMCRWVFDQPDTPGGISIFITRNLNANIPIWRCKLNSVVSVTPLVTTNAAVAAIGAQTKAITIYSTKNPTESVTTSSPNAYAISSLKAGKTLSFQTNGGYAISADWTGSQVSHMWNSCGTASNFIDFPYWACNNGNGLHLEKNCCNWVSDCKSSPQGGITVAIQPLVTPPARFLRIWSCTSSGVWGLDFPLSQIQTLASQATAITIMSRNNPDEYVTTTSSSFALQSLQSGKTISHTTTNGYTSSSQWVGTKTDAIWNSCGWTDSFDVTAYWACNNGNGLHLTKSVCGWTSAGIAPPGGIGIYLHLPTY